jgi:hypothetical protein
MRLSRTILRLGGAALLTLLAASCGFNNTVVSLDYRPPPSRTHGPAIVGAGSFADLRRIGYYNLGTIRSPIGTPMETISTRVPVENIVRNAFSRGLVARGMLAPLNSASYLVTGEIIDLQIEQYVHPTATARLRVNLVRPDDGRVVYSEVFESVLQGNAYMPGSGSPVPELRELMSRALQNVVDGALDSPHLRRKLEHSSGPAYHTAVRTL